MSIEEHYKAIVTLQLQFSSWRTSSVIHNL